jgi:preprotein translocase subunit SecB
MDETKQPGLSIAQIFVSRVHFEHRPDFLDLPADAAPSGGQSPVKVQVRTHIKEDGTSGLISVVVTSDADDALYRYEIEMIGVVTQDPEANMPVGDFLVKNGPAIMYPFVREVIANLTLRGRFGPSWLRPFNWRADEPIKAESST